MPGYIDLHNHILPGIDDGPLTMSEAVLLARALVAVGYETVVATPHSCEGRPAPALILERLQELQEELSRLEIPLKLLPGAEQHIEPETLARLQHKEMLTLNHSRYLLLELPMLQPLPPYTEELIFSLVNAGYRPVIPHPERTRDLQNNFKLLYRLHLLGAIYQVTWGALTGWLGLTVQKTARAMLKANLVHLLATDAHNAASRLLSVDKAAAYLERKLGPHSAELMLTTRPHLLISNESLDLPTPKILP